MILTVTLPGTRISLEEETLVVRMPQYRPKKKSKDKSNDKSMDKSRDIARENIGNDKKGEHSRNEDNIGAGKFTMDHANTEPSSLGRGGVPRKNPVDGEGEGTKNPGKIPDHEKDSINQGDKTGNESKEAPSGKKKSNTGNEIYRYPGQEKFKIPIRNLTSVVVSGYIHVSTAALKALSIHAVPVIIIDHNKPVAIVNPFAAHGTVKVRKAQLACVETRKGFEIARKIVEASLENKARLLLLLAKNRKHLKPGVSKDLRAYVARIRQDKAWLAHLGFTGDPKYDRYRLMGTEGSGARIYFEAISKVIPSGFNFNGRNRRPPRDPVNAMLSLGYAVLQGYVTIGVAANGLEPFAGFLHADRSGKPSLVLDMMEEFRQPLVDRLVLKMIVRQIIKPGDFEQKATGVRLKPSASDTFFQYLLERIAPMHPEAAERATQRNHYRLIIGQARQLARVLLGHEYEYKPFLMDW